MTLGCGPLKTAPFIRHRPMTVNQRYCLKFHLQCLSKTRVFKAIRCHYHRQKSPGNGSELLISEEDSKESDTVSDNEENSQDDLVIADLDEQSTVQMPFLTFVPDEQTAEVTVSQIMTGPLSCRF